jgi:hypothetical protein
MLVLKSDMHICLASDVNCQCIILNRLSLSLYINIYNLMCMDLQHYATSRKVTGLTLDEVFSIDLILQAALWPCGQLTNRNEYQESSWG